MDFVNKGQVPRFWQPNMLDPKRESLARLLGLFIYLFILHRKPFNVFFLKKTPKKCHLLL